MSDSEWIKRPLEFQYVDGILEKLTRTLEKYELIIPEVNEMIRKYALKGPLVEQIQYAFSNELVSSDVIGNPCPAVFDSQATIISPDKKTIILYVWYDNEYGYTRQVVRFSKYIAEVIRLRYY